MSLTNPEQQRLEEIERRLISESPRLAELLAPAAARRESRIRRQWWWVAVFAAVVGAVTFAVGVGLALVGVALGGVFLVGCAPAVARFGPLLQRGHPRWRT